MKRTVTDAVGTVRSHRTLLITLGVMALIGSRLAKASTGCGNCTSSTTSACPTSGTSRRSCGPRALEAAGLLSRGPADRVVRRRADLDSDHGVERTADAVVPG